MALATYSDLQTDVQLWLNRSGDTAITGNVADFIALAEQKLRTDLDLMFMESRNSALTISSEYTSLSTINANITKLHRIYDSTTSPYTNLTYRTPEQLIVDYPSSGLGQPKAFTIAASEIQVRPVPDGTYTYTVNYRAWLNPLSVTPTNTVLTSWPGIYLYSSLRETAAFINDTDAEQYWGGRYMEALDGLRKQYARLNYPGTPLQVRGQSGNP